MFHGDVTVGTPRQTVFHARARAHVRIHISKTAASRYARTGLAVKGNQIQKKGSSQLVAKVDSTCEGLSELRIQLRVHGTQQRKMYRKESSENTHSRADPMTSPHPMGSKFKPEISL